MGDPLANDSIALARIKTATRMVGAAAPGQATPLNPRQKAAIIVRFLLSEGANIPINSLSEDMQAALTHQMSQMRIVDKATLSNVIHEFLSELEGVGISFSGGIEGALSVMAGHISNNAASRLRRLAGANLKADPWDRLVSLPVDQLIETLSDESVEVSAVVLSKLPVAKSAELLSKLPGDRARRVAYAVCLTGNVDPQTVLRIGQSLAHQFDSTPVKAFASDPVDRIGAILNVSTSKTREDVLRGLDETDQSFAESVRKAIFTFVHIPLRLSVKDVPKVVRVADQNALITSLAFCLANPNYENSANHLLNNISQRLAQGLREEAQTRGIVKEKDAEEAMNTIIGAIRQLEAIGELVLMTPDDGFS
jgi:flagellar motor switch protein FliG